MNITPLKARFRYNDTHAIMTGGAIHDMEFICMIIVTDTVGGIPNSSSDRDNHCEHHGRLSDHLTDVTYRSSGVDMLYYHLS
jgi:hypothetical protein